MLKKYANKWVKALRSGKYEQGKNYLTFEDRFCCLGVLCDILKIPSTKNNHALQYGELRQECYLPQEVLDITKMNNPCGVFIDGISLTAMNDCGVSFKDIADKIEKNWENM